MKLFESKQPKPLFEGKSMPKSEAIAKKHGYKNLADIRSVILKDEKKLKDEFEKLLKDGDDDGMVKFLNEN